MKILAAVCFLVSLSAFAKETKIATITSEFDNNKGLFSLELDDKNEIHSLRYLTKLPNGGILEDITIPAERVIREGAVLVERDGRDVIILQVENFNVRDGGTVKLNYLFNGITGTRHIKRLHLALASGVVTLTDQAKQVNRMYIVANSTRIGNVGVKEIQTSYVLEHGSVSPDLD